MADDAPDVLDALPYFDRDLDIFPELKKKVDAEFARIPKAPATPHPRLPPPITLFAVRVLCYADLFLTQSRITLFLLLSSHA